MTITKTIERSRGKRFIRITAELRENHPLLSDGFSVTAELYEPRGTWSGKAQYRNGREADTCGCIHDEVLLFAPKLAPLVAVHLADPNGVPIHAVANGWYYYSGKARAWEESRANGRIEGMLSDMERAARALHIPVEDLPECMGREAFEAFAESLRPRWAAMAATAREVLEGLE